MDRYLQYTFQQFAEDDRFIDWVREPSSTESEIWNDWLTKNPNKKVDVDKARKLVLALQQHTAHDRSMEDALWKKIEQEIQPAEKERSESRHISLWKYLLPIAAVLTGIYLVVGAELFTRSSNVTTNTSLAETDHIHLPKGSTVTLNAESTLSYDKNTWNEQRKLTLEGEAFFEVTKGNTFVVNTAHGDVTVLGTSFNILTRNDRFTVECLTGKVRVDANNSSITLTAGEEAVLRQDELIRNNASKRAEWVSGIYHYKDTPLRDILSDVRHMYGVDINIDDALQENRYTGVVEKDTLSKTLEKIFWTLGMKYKVNGKSVTISQ